MPEKGCDIAKGIVEGQKFKPHAAPARQGRQHDARRPGELPARGAHADRGHLPRLPIKAMSPPSSGGLTVIQMLKMLERFPIGDASQGYGFGTTKTLNVMAEAMRAGLCRPCDLDGRRRLRPGADERPARTRLHRPARRRLIVPGARHPPRPAAGRPASVRSGGPRADDAAGRCRAGDRPGENDDALLGGRQVGQHRVVHQHDRVRHGIGVFAGYTAATARSGTTASCSTTS